ncbi:PspC domain-containing protein [Dactylosporangium fulvum]|uniref:PspC domain-containing protein n=1 Tax=Dactylosporangium fulvum TaxID=53359 RepID=A0ABY5VMZ8_9ACTN|nr:PspC domain-containing protein [Dactylosporangium fulvum]UWP78409.1 PspC domain-containing protein [Dactylosporangium fulvum]
MTDIKRLRRSRSDRTVAGVLGGIAEYLDADPTMIRAVYLLAILLTGGTAVLAYPILWLVMPEAPPSPVSPAPNDHLPYGA